MEQKVKEAMAAALSATKDSPMAQAPRVGNRMLQDSILTTREAAPILKAHPRTLRRWAAEGYGPPRLRITPRRSGYRVSDIEAWIAGLTAANGRGAKNAA